MKKYLFTFILPLLTLSIILAQEDSIETNSYEHYLKKDYPQLSYRYDDAHQTHSYSGNWDFDGDKIPDSLFFTGNGGIHLFYQLKIVLSSGHPLKNFPTLLMDIPYLGKAEDITKEEVSLLPQFAVHDFDADGIMEIYINYDPSFSSVQKKWKSEGVTSRQILIKIKNNNLVIKNFKRD
jgi:hypothetical protein